jgi:hypothetical protein
MRGPNAPARAMRGLGFTLYQAPPGVPATTSDHHASTLSCRVAGLPLCRRGS